MKRSIKVFAAAILLALFSSGHAMSADPVVLGPLDRVLGNDDAPLTIIEYASMTCPHCAHFHTDVMPSIKTNWIDTGKARLVYRDFPTGPINVSLAVSMITQCAPKAQYFPVVGLLFKSQDRWAGANPPIDEIKRLVALAGLSSNDVDACLQRKDLSRALEDRAMQGSAQYNIQSTPTLIIGSERMEGAQSYAEVNRLLEAAYAKAVKP